MTEPDFIDERVLCTGCRASLVVEYCPDAASTSPHRLPITCPGCQAAVDIVLPRAASIYIVRRSGDTPVLRRRLPPQ